MRHASWSPLLHILDKFRKLRVTVNSFSLGKKINTISCFEWYLHLQMPNVTYIENNYFGGYIKIKLQDTFICGLVNG